MAAATKSAPFILKCQNCEEEIDLKEDFNTFPKCIHTICCTSPRCLEQSVDMDPDTLICPKCVEGYKMQKLMSRLKRLGIQMSTGTGSGLSSSHPDSSQSARPNEPNAGVQVPPGSGSSLLSPHPDSSQSTRPAEHEAVSSTQGGAAGDPSPPTSETKRCGISQCKTCPHVNNLSEVMGPSNGPSRSCIPVIGMHDCKSDSIRVYYWCKVCKKAIVEKTKQKLHQRMNGHRTGNTIISEHFELPNHEFERDLKVSVIDNIGADRSQDMEDRLKKLSHEWVDVGDQTHVT